MSFQTIIDNASNIKYDNRSLVSTTISRSGYQRTVSRGGQPWRFEIEFPSGPDWRVYRRLIADIVLKDRHTSEIIRFNNPGHAWIFGYQGNIDFSGIGPTPQAAWASGATTFTIAQGGAVSGFNFRVGDIVQLGSTGQVYQVMLDCPAGNTVVTVHRPIIENTSPTGTAFRVGANCEFRVLCTQMPRFNLFSINQFGFDAPFVFTEVYN